ncbi:MAG: hypothetical protein H0W25_09155, partial [Acidimicrobiia bacterium]|nr:hypothetical protein [Acidimicrobiia bacterium]
VVVIGNADRFDAATSRVVFFDERLTAAAALVAEGAGVAAPERDTGPNPNDLVDITLVVGADLASAYGLLPRG